MMKQDAKKAIKAFDAKIEKIKQKFIEKLNELPDNPNISRLGNKCYSVNISQLNKHDNWEPFFHDFKSQYEFIIKYISEPKRQVTTIINALDTIVETGQLREREQGTKRFHPEVRQQLKEIL